MGVVSGVNGCIVPSKSFQIVNLINAELTECKAKFEPTDICPDQNVGTDGTTKIKPLGYSKVTYFTAPPSLGCSRIMKISCKWGSEVCENWDINVPIPNFYVKKKRGEPTKCEICGEFCSFD